MRIAYLILAHDNPVQLTRLINALTHADSHIFLHVDKKSKIDPSYFLADDVSVLEDRVTVKWGYFSVVEATLNLVKEAVAFGHFDYYVLLSGSSYPLRGNDDILDFFQKNAGYEYIKLFGMPALNKPLSRIEYFYSQDGVPHYFFKLLLMIMQFCKIRRGFPKTYLWMKPYAGSQWWALSDPCVKYLLKFVEENPEFVNFFKKTWIPSEMFFQTIIGNSPFKKQVKSFLIYVDWFFSSWSPALLKRSHFQVIKAIIQSNHDDEQILFARKFQDASRDIIDLIDEHFLKKEKTITDGFIKVNGQENIQKITTPRSKYLVFTSAGDNSNLHHWLRGHRNFDLWITYYGDQPGRYRDIADFYNIRKGFKYPNLHYIYQKWPQMIDQYEAVLVIDDDIIMSSSDINRLFDIRRRYDLWLCQPAFEGRSKISHEITSVKLCSFMRYTNFVENTCPVFRKDKLDAFMKVYDPILVGHGIDWWYLKVLGPDLKYKVAIVDAVTCINPYHPANVRKREMDKFSNLAERKSVWSKIELQHDIQTEKKGCIEFGPVSNVTSFWDHIAVFKTALVIIFSKEFEKIRLKIDQIRRSRFHVISFRMPFHLKIEVLLLKIKTFFGFDLDSRGVYLNQLLYMLNNINVICPKENADTLTVRIRPGLEIVVNRTTDIQGEIKRIWGHWAIVNLILQTQTLENGSDLKVITTLRDADDATLDLKNNFPNAKIIVLKPDQIEADGITKLMKAHGWEGIDLFYADQEGAKRYLLNEEKAANVFLSKIKFISIQIQEEPDLCNRIYQIFRNNRFTFSVKDGLTIGYNKDHLSELR